MTPRSAALLVLLASVSLAWSARAQDAGAPNPGSPAAVQPVPVPWPHPGAPLTAPELSFSRRGRKLRLFLDAGHGAPGNPGNTSCACEQEQDFTLRVAKELARRLEATGRFKVRLSRDGEAKVRYPARVDEAEAWNADVFVSLHSDARGQALLAPTREGRACPRNDAEPGFSVLWSDEGDRVLIHRRQALAQALARRMWAAGFTPYDGVNYVGLYDGDPQPGVYVDRRPFDKRVFVLRRPKMPSVIIETHHALDFEEAARWREDRTLDVFAAVVADALVEQLAPEPVGGVPPPSRAGRPDIKKSALTR